MRAYTLSVLQKLAGSDKPIADAEIIAWVNETLAAAEKSSSIRSFKVCLIISCAHDDVHLALSCVIELMTLGNLSRIHRGGEGGNWDPPLQEF